MADGRRVATIRSDFQLEAILVSVIPKNVSSSVAVMVGTKICWTGPTTTFRKAVSSKA